MFRIIFRRYLLHVGSYIRAKLSVFKLTNGPIDPNIRGARFGHRLPTIHDLQNPIQQPVRHMMTNSNTARRKCMICLDEFFGEDIKPNFPHSCGKCSTADYCTKCIKEWFIEACKNESKMPPKCCSAIPLSTIASHLEIAQASSPTY